MVNNTFNQQEFNPYEHEPLRSLQRPLQHELATHGIDASPEEAHNLFMQKFVHDAERWLQQYLAEQGINVSPDEAVTIQRLRLIQRIMENTDIIDPHDAIERMIFDGSTKPSDMS
jgi:hypothetical protein